MANCTVMFLSMPLFYLSVVTTEILTHTGVTGWVRLMCASSGPSCCQWLPLLLIPVQNVLVLTIRSVISFHFLGCRFDWILSLVKISSTLRAEHDPTQGFHCTLKLIKPFYWQFHFDV